MTISCVECGVEFPRRMGRVPKFCSDRCRQRACRKRRSVTFPKEFLVQPRWVRARGKRPVMPCGAPASSTDSSTWGAFEGVMVGAGDGFGVMLGGGLGCYDFDDCFKGEILDSQIIDFIKSIPEQIVFVEKSVSGRGLHIFFKCDSESRGYRRAGVERYTQGRFIRTTLDVFQLPL